MMKVENLNGFQKLKNLARKDRKIYLAQKIQRFIH